MNNYFTTIAVLKPFLEDKTIGFVPTMGALHAGHLSLIEASLKENDLTVISIFVNPTQFNQKEDFEKYPRDVKADVSLLGKYKNKILIYAPDIADIYPNEIKSQSFEFDGIENQMEGKFRPGHFDGVGTVVKRLLELIKPVNAYFGEKDFQQLQIVKKLVEKEKIPVNIVGCPILREPSGLAMSSRNKRLNKKQLEAAPLIYKTLQDVRKNFGTKNAKELLQDVEKAFKNHAELQLEYFEIAEEKTLIAITELEKTDQSQKYRAFIAVFAGNIRLIDNIAL